MEPHYRSPLPPEAHEALAKLTSFLSEKVMPRLDELSGKEHLEEDEKEELRQIAQILQKAAPSLTMAHELLSTSAVKGATDLFFYFRSLGQQGNEQAKEAYEGLRPYYESMAKENLDLN